LSLPPATEREKLSRADGGIWYMSEERKIEIRVRERNDKVEIIIDDKELVDYLYDWAEDWEIEFDTDVPDRPLLVIKFYIR
jgi:hypothetical protein